MLFPQGSTWGLLGPEVSSHHNMSDRRGSVLLRGLPSWQVWASTTACVCTHMHRIKPGNSHSCAAVTVGAEWEILYRRHICNEFPVHCSASWDECEVTEFHTSSVFDQHHLTIDWGPNELEWCRCLGCPCLRPSSSESAITHFDSVSTQSWFLQHLSTWETQNIAYLTAGVYFEYVLPANWTTNRTPRLYSLGSWVWLDHSTSKLIYNGSLSCML